MPVASQAAGVFIAFSLILFSAIAYTRNVISSAVFWLLFLHLMATTLSFIFSNDTGFNFLARYLFLLPAFISFILISNYGESGYRSFIIGLTLGIAIFGIANLRNVNIAGVGDVYSRLDSFLNPNGIGFISAMGAIVAFCSILFNPNKKKKALFSFLLIVFLVVLVSTKSRTSLGCFVIGATITGLHFIKHHRWPIYLSPIFLLIGFFLFSDSLFVLWQVVYENILGGQVRSNQLSTLTGRTIIWQAIYENVFMPSPFIGSGPGSIQLIIGESPHNGFIWLLAETGIVGAMPMLIILVMALRGIWRIPIQASRHVVVLARSLFFAGLAESMAEQFLFSIGNPGSLLFLTTTVYLASICRRAYI